MAQQTRHISGLIKRDIKQMILVFIGHPINRTGSDGVVVQIKKEPNKASRKEIHDLLKSDLVTNKGTKGIDIPKRTLLHFLEELRNKGWVRHTGKGMYELTELGKKRLSILDSLYFAFQRTPMVDPLGLSLSFGRDEKGKITHADIMIRVTRPEIVQSMIEAVTKNRVKDEDEKMLGRLLSTVIMWHLKGVFSRLPDMMEGNEDVLLQILSKLPFTE